MMERCGCIPWWAPITCIWYIREPPFFLNYRGSSRLVWVVRLWSVIHALYIYGITGSQTPFCLIYPHTSGTNMVKIINSNIKVDILNNIAIPAFIHDTVIVVNVSAWSLFLFSPSLISGLSQVGSPITWVSRSSPLRSCPLYFFFWEFEGFYSSLIKIELRLFPVFSSQRAVFHHLFSWPNRKTLKWH